MFFFLIHQVDETVNILLEAQDRFYKIQLTDEVNLSERIDALMGNVTNVALQHDINKTHEIAIDIKRIWKIIKECQEQGLLLNERQVLFGTPVTPYENLTRLNNEFEPYKTLWITASGE